jgi:hypothetical protein
MPIDQAHEQLNKVVKEEGGVIGITANRVAMERSSLTSGDIARCIQEFERGSGLNRLTPAGETCHHEEEKSYSVRFAKNVSNLLDVFHSKDNPFLDQTPYLVSLDGKVMSGNETEKGVVQL